MKLIHKRPHTTKKVTKPTELPFDSDAVSPTTKNPTKKPTKKKKRKTTTTITTTTTTEAPREPEDGPLPVEAEEIDEDEENGINEIIDCSDEDADFIASDDCTQYYRCDNGKPVKFNCKPGTAYHTVTHVCVWIANNDREYCRKIGSKIWKLS